MIRMMLSTVGSRVEAEKMATTLVSERVVACVNVVGGLTSIYRWEGEVQNESEVLMILKTAEDRLDDAIRRLKELHPYDVPEIVVLDPERGWPAYLSWVIDETRPDET